MLYKWRTIWIINNHMPTEREHKKYNPEPHGYGQHNPELKATDEPSSRLPFLDKAEYFIIRICIFILAIYGLYTLVSNFIHN